MDHTKQEMSEIGKRFGIDWVCYNEDTGRHTFQKAFYRSYKVINLQGEVTQESGIFSESWIPASERVYLVTECYPDQIDNGDLEFMLKHGLTQSAPRN